MSDTPRPGDPRLDLPLTQPEPEDAQPVVGRAPQRATTVAIIMGFAVSALVLFLVLNSARTRAPAASLVTPTAVEVVSDASPPPLRIPTPPPPPPPPPAPQLAPPPPPPPPAIAQPAGPDPTQKLRTPTIVVDLGAADDETATASPAPGAGVGSAATAGVASAGRPRGAAATLAASDPALAAAAAGGGAADLLAAARGGGAASSASDDQFASRVADEEPDRAHAFAMRHLDALVPQGAIIPAVLETAIDSDLPGYARAVVSRDVRSFDGKVVLIPRGSRIIGQYKSGLALGASRAFVIWTRVIRPDGVSIMIGSPGGDALGRGGLSGKVDRHFFTRFGGSILLSVLNGGIAALTRNASTQITIASPGAAIGAAGAVIQGDNIPPTVRVAQGEAVRIFVARDLDFSGVGPVQ